jgi:uncharacterized protein (DUF1330 family)
MPALAVAHMRSVNVGPAIIEYLERIDDTLKPFGGRFLVHGGWKECVEGRWVGDLIVIQFPDLQHLRDWYASEAYRAILPLRTQSSEADIIFVETEPPGHRATDVLGDIV